MFSSSFCYRRNICATNKVSRQSTARGKRRKHWGKCVDARGRDRWEYCRKINNDLLWRTWHTEKSPVNIGRNGSRREGREKLLNQQDTVSFLVWVEWSATHVLVSVLNSFKISYKKTFFSLNLRELGSCFSQILHVIFEMYITVDNRLDSSYKF